MYDLNNKNIVITGGTGGLGSELCKEISKYKCNLIIIDLDEEKLKKLKNELEANEISKGNINIFKIDVKSEEEISQTYKNIIDQFFHIDILINNAGAIHYNNVFDLTVEKWDQILNVNLRGTFLITKYFAKSMRENKEGKILNISSVAAISGVFGGAAYTSSKSGIIGLTKVLAKELSEFNINVNSISPGPLDGNFLNKNSDDEGRAMRVEKSLFNRMGEYRDIVKPALFFISSDSDWITGQNVFVDGGYTVQ